MRSDADNNYESMQDEDLESSEPSGPINRCLSCLCNIIFCLSLQLCCLTVCALTPLFCCCGITNSAIQRAQGKRYSSTLNRWVIDNIEDDAKELLNVPDDDRDIINMNSEDDTMPEYANQSTPLIEVKEKVYYDALGVAPDANEAKIKRAYYVNARKWHPDRNDTAEAKEKFQKVGEAYQVLSDVKLRAQYDKEGEAGLSGDRTELAANNIDPSLIFTFLFGSDAFNHIVGRLQLVTQTIAGGKGDAATMQELENRRVVRLALALLKQIQNFVAGDEERAKNEWIEEAKELVEVRYGEEILNTVGGTYKIVATQTIGTWTERRKARYAEYGQTINAASALTKNVREMARDGDIEQGAFNEDQIPSFVSIMWNITVMDITTTLREVVMKVLHDQSVDHDVRQKRAKAILTLGDIFEQQKSIQHDEEKDIREMFQNAAQAAMEETLHKMNDEENSR